jgi:hypothetical protein
MYSSCLGYVHKGLVDFRSTSVLSVFACAGLPHVSMQLEENTLFRKEHLAVQSLEALLCC